VNLSRRPHPVEAYLDLIESRSPREAARLALGELDEGYRPDEVIVGLLAAAQRETGRRWQRGIWTVAHEHQATAVTDAALHELVSYAPARPADRGHLIVVCAEGDWHTLPSRMAAEILRLDGWDVTFLGASLPTPDLARWLRDVRPDGVVVSCSLPTCARGVLATATVAAEVGVRVVAGGRGMGGDPRRATSLGVGWAADPAAVPSALTEQLEAPDPRVLQERLDADVAARLARQRIVDSAMARLALLWPPMAGLTAPHLARTEENLGHILDFAGAAALTGDSRVFTEFLDWLTERLTARGMPLDALHLGLRALAVNVPTDLRFVAGLLSDAIESDAIGSDAIESGETTSSAARFGASTLPAQNAAGRVAPGGR
jgi:methanogenic corrinoid protein MtbC1